MRLVSTLPLDLKQCETVSDIVNKMSRCAIGARMLGEVTATLTKWCCRIKKPVIIYDGKPGTKLANLLGFMVSQEWFEGVYTPDEYSRRKHTGERVLVVGRFSERDEDVIFQKPERALFINKFDLAPPGLVQDGYFPDVVFSDPRFIMPILFAVLSERLGGNRVPVSQFITMLEGYGGLADQVFRGAGTLNSMFVDTETTIMLTVSGAMTIAKMGLVLCDLIDSGRIALVCTTGALMAHGLVDSVGLRHYKYDPTIDDAKLAREKINRVTDSLEPESNLDHVEVFLRRAILSLDGSRCTSPVEINELVGRDLAKRFPKKRGILKSAYEQHVPVLVPAFHDSELGNDIRVENLRREMEGKPDLIIDMELDTDRLREITLHARVRGIFTIGGGVPRNFVQNVAPLIDIINERLHRNMPPCRFHYGCRICPDKPYYGHLSGSTYEEGKSWGKMDPKGIFAEIMADATLVLPFLAKYVLDGH